MKKYGHLYSVSFHTNTCEASKKAQFTGTHHMIDGMGKWLLKDESIIVPSSDADTGGPKSSVVGNAKDGRMRRIGNGKHI